MGALGTLFIEIITFIFKNLRSKTATVVRMVIFSGLIVFCVVGMASLINTGLNGKNEDSSLVAIALVYLIPITFCGWRIAKDATRIKNGDFDKQDESENASKDEEENKS